MKNVPKNEFLQFISDKLNKQEVDTTKAYDENQAFLTTLMPPPPNRTPSGGLSGQQQDLLEMAANQSIQEEAHSNGGVEVKKVGFNFNGLKLTDCKKRMRPTFAQGGVLAGTNINGGIGSSTQNQSYASLQPHAYQQEGIQYHSSGAQEGNDQMSGITSPQAMDTDSSMGGGTTF